MSVPSNADKTIEENKFQINLLTQMADQLELTASKVVAEGAKHNEPKRTYKSTLLKKAQENRDRAALLVQENERLTLLKDQPQQ